MEDEHVCIDNILEHLGSTADFPSPGAFYGVRSLISNRYVSLWLYRILLLLLLINEASNKFWVHNYQNMPCSVNTFSLLTLLLCCRFLMAMVVQMQLLLSEKTF